MMIEEENSSSYYDFEQSSEFQQKMSWYTQRFVIYPEQLMSLSLPTSLNWKSIKFNNENKKDVSDKRGVYAFVIQHKDNNLPNHGYITYVGITGNESSSRNLRKRYGDYLREQRRPKRRSIHMMLNKWKDCLYFNYAELEDDSVDLSFIEDRLNDAIIPPYSTNDFTADVRQAKGIWEKS